MKIKVSGGSFKSRFLQYPSEISLRPTTSKVKEAIFNMIGNEIKGKRVLDLFCASGNLGIEALSRGAESVVFVDHAQKVLKYLSINLKNLNIQNRVKVIKMDVIKFLKRSKEKFELIFADPPYRKGWIERILPHCVTLLAPQGIIVVEHEKELILKDLDDLKIIKKKKYGDTAITIFKRKNSYIPRGI